MWKNDKYNNSLSEYNDGSQTSKAHNMDFYITSINTKHLKTWLYYEKLWGSISCLI